jgi:hypothetical protein
MVMVVIGVMVTAVVIVMTIDNSDECGRNPLAGLAAA